MTDQHCAFCQQPLTEIIDFGSVALAGGFLKASQFDQEQKYPLALCMCASCGAVQLSHHVKPETMFREYFYFSSATETVRRHFKSYADEMIERFNPRTALEIGCNDGVLLHPLLNAGVKAIGIDPSSTVPRDLYVINDYFTEEVAQRAGKVDMVCANNVMAHVSDINGITRAISTALSGNGVFVMEAHYLGAMLDGLQYDWIYHEHLYYYSLIALENHFKRHGLMVFDVKPVELHGGSMRYYVCREGKREQSKAVSTLRAIEVIAGLASLGTLMDFAKRVNEHRQELRDFLSRFPGDIAGYGASGRANAIIQYCGLKLDYIIDDAPAKYGYYTPGSHIPIYGGKTLHLEKPAAVLVFAWTYLEEIRMKCNFPMIVPFPSVRVIDAERIAA